jgi:hypothetical protein
MMSEVVARIRHHVVVPSSSGRALYASLDAEPQRGVLAGWPTFFLGPLDRFLGYAAAAAGLPDRTRHHLAGAIVADRWMRPHLLRSLDAWRQETGDPLPGIYPRCLGLLRDWKDRAIRA